MNEFFVFFIGNPFLAIILMFFVYSLITCPIRYGFRAYNRYLRSKNIASRGWPPAHLDADGDFKEES